MTREIKYRTNGTVGALLDEYEKAIYELTLTIDGLDEKGLVFVVDSETKDEDCKSIQTLLTHIVQSGFTYVVEIRKWLGEEINYRDKVTLNSVQEYKSELSDMFNFTESLFIDHPDINLTELDFSKKIKVKWGQTFDIEQLMQHAIVHILRHRRQIEKFKLKLITSS